MAIFGEMTYLLFYGEEMHTRLFMVAATCTGFFIHLLLDEIYSVEWDGRPHLKRSFGTAMKFAGENWWANATCYGKLAILTYFVLIDPSVVQQLSAGQGQQVAQNLGDEMKERFGAAKAAVQSKTSGNGVTASLWGGGGTNPAAGSAPITGAPTVPPPALTWPATGAQATAASGGNGYGPAPGTNAYQGAQGASPAGNWTAPADPAAANAGYTGRSRRGANQSPAAAANGYYPPAGNQPVAPAAAPVANGYYAPVGNQPAAPVAAPAATPGRYWQ
jgi:hypothetical protein